jgi:hypothetical protein
VVLHQPCFLYHTRRGALGECALWVCSAHLGAGRLSNVITVWSHVHLVWSDIDTVKKKKKKEEK